MTAGRKVWALIGVADVQGLVAEGAVRTFNANGESIKIELREARPDSAVIIENDIERELDKAPREAVVATASSTDGPSGRGTGQSGNTQNRENTSEARQAARPTREQFTTPDGNFDRDAYTQAMQQYARELNMDRATDRERRRGGSSSRRPR